MICRIHPHQPDLIQVMLLRSLRVRVLRYPHYSSRAGHAGQTRFHCRGAAVYYWPKPAADIAHTVRECIPRESGAPLQEGASSHIIYCSRNTRIGSNQNTQDPPKDQARLRGNLCDLRTIYKGSANSPHYPHYGLERHRLCRRALEVQVRPYRYLVVREQTTVSGAVFPTSLVRSFMVKRVHGYVPAPV